jgi:His-Xaa-Ser system protein HxsD
MCEKMFEKQLYSEWVIRNSLYWMTSLTQWKLCEDISSWTICMFSEQQWLKSSVPEHPMKLERCHKVDVTVELFA